MGNKGRLARMTALVCMVLLLSAGLALAGGRGVTDDSVKMGFVLVKTGPVAALGIPQGNGMIDYMNYINEKGGINGRKIKMLWEDDGFQAPKAVAAVKKLISRDKEIGRAHV